MSTFDLVLKGGTIICHDGIHALDLAIQSGKIAARGENLEGVVEIDATGKLIVPGGVDPHVHLQMPAGNTITSDDWSSGSLAALFGGTTTLLDFVEPEAQEDLLSAFLKRKTEATGKSWVHFGLHMTVASVQPDILNQIELMRSVGVSSFKSYTTYDSLKLDYAQIGQVMKTVAAGGGVLMVHAEDDQILVTARQQLADDGHLDPAFFPQSRPPQAEVTAVRRLIDLSRENACQLYIVHVSTSEAIHLITQASRDGLPVMAETCPQYLLLNTSKFSQDDPLASAGLICSPALRDERENTKLWDCILHDQIQTIGSDHCSFTLQPQKAIGLTDFRKVPGGLPGIELRYGLIHSSGVVDHQLALTRWVDLCSTMPAMAFGLYPRKGSLEVGADADIVVFDPGRDIKITRSLLHENVDYTPYEEFSINAWPERVILSGKTVVLDGELVAEHPAGEYVFCDTPKWRRNFPEDVQKVERHGK